MSDGLIGIIGGSGLGQELGNYITDAEVRKVNTPFGRPSGDILVGRIGDKKIAFLNRHGAGHTLSPSVVPYRANIFAMKTLGVTTLIASGAVGSLRQEIRPKELVVVDQFIDKTHKRESSFFGELGAVHSEFSHPCCERLGKAILDASSKIRVKTHEKGVYVCMEGPAFSTRAESLMHRHWGGDLIGMTAMPEAKLAREAQMCYALIALASDYDCWKEHEPGVDKQALLAEIIGNLTAATNNAIELIKAVIEAKGAICSDDCGCRKSLELAVWTDPKAIDEKKKEELGVLFY